MMPDVLDAYGVIHLPVWLTMGSIDDARAILSAMLGCVSTVLALIFSVALLVLSMVATLFGPRLLYRFLQDWITQATLGVFLGTFVYLCLVFLVTHQDAHTSFVPQVSLIASWFLVVMSFGFLVYYSHRIATSIQNPDMIARIVDDLRPSVSARVAPKGRDFTAEEIEEHLAEAAPIESLRSGYVQAIDQESLVEVATREDAVIHVLFRPGQFVLDGETLASVVPRDRAQALKDAVTRAVKLGHHRTIHQDSEFGIAQIVEIGIRALSPAVNDTFTGVACVDWLADALVVLAAAAPRRSKVIGPTRAESFACACDRSSSNASSKWDSINCDKRARTTPRCSFAFSTRSAASHRACRTTRHAAHYSFKPTPSTSSTHRASSRRSIATTSIARGLMFVLRDGDRSAKSFEGWMKR